MQNIRNLAYKFILMQGINKLPITMKSLEHIAVKNGWIIMPYSKCRDFFVQYSKYHKIDLKKYASTKYAFAIINKIHPIIFYYDNLTEMQKIFAILHEMAHIILGHTSSNGIIGLNEKEEKEKIQEWEADVFAYEVCAPEPVLRKARKTADKSVLGEQIGLGHENGMIEPRKKRKYTALEKAVCVQFEDYIKERKSENKKRLVKKSIMSVAACLVFAAIFAFSFTGLNYFYREVYSEKANIWQQEEIHSSADITDKEKKEVYLTKTGKKYHIEGCRYIEGKDNLITVDEKEAQRCGYEPCSICIGEKSIIKDE